MNKGKVIQIIGAVVDVEFDSKQLPGIYDALELELGKKSENNIPP